MSHLAISFLGPFHVSLDDEPVTRFSADTARALLAYLAMHPGVAHRRSALAGLLWPEQPDAEALRNLRVALSRLREAIGDRDADTPFLLVSRTTIQLNPQVATSLDVRTFRALLAATKAHDHERLAACAACAGRLGEATALYRGEFLAEFSLDSAPFEEWMVVEREGLHWQTLEALEALATFHEGRGEYQETIRYARRQAELEPWREVAHRQWMRALALSGHRGAALAQYETCRQVLSDELSVEPEGETTALYEQIRAGKLTAPVLDFLVLSAVAPEPGEAQGPSPSTPEPARVDDERRIVTVVQGTVSESADLLVRLGSEGWATIMSQVLRTLGGEVRRFGGEVDRYSDEGLIAIFGAVAAHEDNPEWAVLAALSMQDAFATCVSQLFAQEEEGAGGLNDLQLRVSVHTGEAIVTALEGSGRHSQGKAMGEATAFVAQIHALAEPGEVWVSESTYRLVEPLFEWETDEGVGERGPSRRFTIYRPMTHKGLADKGRGIPGLRSPLVGRERELRALREVVERLQDGIGGIVTLVGEAGIGKSRLVAEIREICKSQNRQISTPTTQPPRAALRANARSNHPAVWQPHNLQWMEGRCLSYAVDVAYQVWLDMLRGLLGRATDAPPDTIRAALEQQAQNLCADCLSDVYPFLARMMSLPLDASAEARLRGLDAEGLKVLTFRAVETLVERVAQRGPLVIVCEDLHWADRTSLELLEQLLATTDRLPLLFICMFRPEMEHGCWQIKDTATRLYHHRHTDLWLHPLSAAESETLVSNLLSIETLPRELRERILDRAEGNPFYVEEILRSLIDDEVIAYDENAGRWQAVRGPSDIAIPGTLHGVLAARIDRLPQEAKRVLQLASVVGRFFSYRLLAAIAEPGRLDDHLVTLQRTEMIRERARVPEVAYVFKHVLTQEVAYSGLLRRARRTLHRRVAKALERLYPERIEEQLGLLAYHWEQAGEVERAVSYLRRAGEQAAAQFAHAEALGCLSRALDLMGDADIAGQAPERYALLLIREGVYDLQGAREAQYRDLQDLKELAEALVQRDKGQQATRRLAEATLREANYVRKTGVPQDAMAVAWTAVRLAQAARDANSEAAGYLEWGKALGDGQAAVPRLKLALSLAQAARCQAVEADSLRELGKRSRYQGNYAAARARFVQTLRIYRETGDRWGEGRALNTLGEVSYDQGDYAAARSYSEQSLRLCRETGNRFDEAWALVDLGWVSLAQGDYAGARLNLDQALGIFRQVGRRWSEATVLQCLGAVACKLGDDTGARACFDQASRIRQEVNPGKGFAMAYPGLLLHHLGDDQAARNYSQQLLQLSEDLGWRRYHAEALTVLGHALAGLGQPSEAADAYRQALALRREMGQHHLAPEPLAGLARVALTQGERLQALAPVEEILSHLETHPTLDGTQEPLRVYLTCVRVLRANDDPRAGQALEAAYRLLQERASKIEDEALRRSYLENVVAHREIVAEYEQRSGMRS